jgi:hypothetical protein
VRQTAVIVGLFSACTGLFFACYMSQLTLTLRALNKKA